MAAEDTKDMQAAGQDAPAAEAAEAPKPKARRHCQNNSGNPPPAFTFSVGGSNKRCIFKFCHVLTFFSGNTMIAYSSLKNKVTALQGKKFFVCVTMMCDKRE